MKKSKEELVALIEEARKELNGSIEGNEDYNLVYQYSVKLDQLIEQYIVAGY